MEFFDDAVSKAKEAIDVACKKTNEVVTLQKQKFNVAALESRRAKDFQLLGEIIYNKIMIKLELESKYKTKIKVNDKYN